MVSEARYLQVSSPPSLPQQEPPGGGSCCFSRCMAARRLVEAGGVGYIHCVAQRLASPAQIALIKRLLSRCDGHDPEELHWLQNQVIADDTAQAAGDLYALKPLDEITSRQASELIDKLEPYAAAPWFTVTVDSAFQDTTRPDAVRRVRALTARAAAYRIGADYCDSGTVHAAGGRGPDRDTFTIGRRQFA